METSVNSKRSSIVKKAEIIQMISNRGHIICGTLIQETSSTLKSHINNYEMTLLSLHP